jgi:hypothetical protein
MKIYHMIRKEPWMHRYYKRYISSGIIVVYQSKKKMPRNENRRVKISKVNKEGKNIQEYDGKKDVSNLGAGDSYYISNFTKKNKCGEIFQKLLSEITFVQMFSFSENWTKVTPYSQNGFSANM